MLITFEGIDGSGKSTQIQLLKNWLEAQKKKAVIFREPGSSSLSEQIREILLDSKNDIHPVAEMLLFSAARAQLVATQIKPQLEEGTIVLLDRYYHSTLAYQGFGRKAATIEAIQHLNSLATLGLEPDMTFLLEISYDEAQNRRVGTQKDRMEQTGEQFYKDVIKGYSTLNAMYSNFFSIDATQTVEEIHEQIIDLVSVKL